MVKVKTEDILKHGAKLRDWTTNPLTDEDVEKVVKPIREWHRQQRELDRWSPEKQRNLERHMTI